MRIGELAVRTRCDIETIRYYEKTGLLAAPPRNSSGYREYGATHLEHLHFIRHCRSLRIGLADIRILLQLKTSPDEDCVGVDTLLEGHITRVREQRAMLETLEQQLVTLRNQCRQPRVGDDCGILQNLSEAAEDHDCACHDVPGQQPGH